MIPKNITYGLLAAACLLLNNPVMATDTAPKDSLIIRFFKERIEDFEKKGNYSFSDQKVLDLRNLKSAKQHIWQLWKTANQNDHFPKMEIKAPKKIEDFPIHQWTLHGEDPMPFYFVKKSPAPEGGHPLFLNLHGSGPKVEEFPGTLMWSLHYKDAPSAYFIPQIPNERRYRWWYKPEQYAWEKLFRIAMLDSSINANKIYVMGISEGGYGSQRLGAFYADYLAGAGPMAGGEPLENAPPSNFEHIAFSLQTGEHDYGFGRNKQTQLAAQVFDSLAAKHPGSYRHQIQLQPGKDHGSIDYMVTSPWLVQQVRNAQPASLDWVLFPMHDRYRRAFYNIGIEQPLAIAEGQEYDRARFQLQMDKATNTVRLQVQLQDKTGAKTQIPQQGKIALYLSPDRIDLSKKIKVFYNGKQVHNGKVKLQESTLIESCALFGDPERLFPSKITIDLHS